MEIIYNIGFIIGNFFFGFCKICKYTDNSIRKRQARLIIKGGIHAFFINKGYQVSYREVEDLYNKTKSEVETTYILTLKYELNKNR